MKLQNNLTPENSPLRSLSTTMKPQNSSMLWATNCYPVCWHHSLWENCGHLRVAPCLVPALQMHRARPRQSTKQTLLLLLWLPVARHLGITLASPAPWAFSSVHHYSCESFLSLWTSEKDLLVGEGEKPHSTYWRRKDQPLELQLHLLCTIYYLGWWLKNCLHCQVKDWITGF